MAPVDLGRACLQMSTMRDESSVYIRTLTARLPESWVQDGFLTGSVGGILLLYTPCQSLPFNPRAKTNDQSHGLENI